MSPSRPIDRSPLGCSSSTNIWWVYHKAFAGGIEIALSLFHWPIPVVNMRSENPAYYIGAGIQLLKDRDDASKLKQRIAHYERHKL